MTHGAAELATDSLAPLPAGRISIALCTCNGERFLQQQLDSLKAQSTPPAELVVCDDASDDRTMAILQAFARSAPFPVRLQRNPVRLGIQANFEHAIRLCSGDVIALCDQDDVWLPNKLERMARQFLPAVDWVFCDAEVCDAALHPLGYSMWQRVQFDARAQALADAGRMFELLLKRQLVAGATLAFRSGQRSRLLPVPAHWHYDAWLAMVLSATGKLALVESPLQQYRQHANNAIGARRRSLLDEARLAWGLNRQSYYREELMRWSALSQRIAPLSAPAGALVAEKIAHLQRRQSLPSKRWLRWLPIAREVLRGGYGRYARNFGSVAIDLLLR